MIDKYIRLIDFAAAAHSGMKITGSETPYLVHLIKTTAETIEALKYHPGADESLAIHAAMLHDTIEDTQVTFRDISDEFSHAVAEAVLSLTKNKEIDPELRMDDSLARIRQQPREVWMVKMADRISNLSKPPASWTKEKIRGYARESLTIHNELGGASDYLAARLKTKIDEYRELYSRDEKSSGDNFVRVEGFKGRIYSPAPLPDSMKKHPCRDCYACRFCADDACAICLKSGSR